ncbi:MAG: hypothetical protein R3F11_00405 [Verrucomicrobiales bacterium]
MPRLVAPDALILYAGHLDDPETAQEALAALRQRCEAAGAAGIAITPPSNLLDQPPIRFEPLPVNDILPDMEAGRWTEAQKALWDMAVGANDNAWSRYLIARAMAGDPAPGEPASPEALEQFRIARQLDGTQIRASDPLFAALRSAFPDGGGKLGNGAPWVLVDAAAALDPLAGDRLFSGAVTPNFAGAYAIAARVFPELVKALPPPVLAKARQRVFVPPLLRCQDLLGFSGAERLLEIERQAQDLIGTSPQERWNRKRRLAALRAEHDDLAKLYAGVAAAQRDFAQARAIALRSTRDPAAAIVAARHASLAGAGIEGAALLAHPLGDTGFAEWIARMPAHPGPLVAAAQAYADGMDFAPAEQICREFIRRHGSDPRIQRTLARIMVRRGEMSRTTLPTAVDYAETLARKLPDDAEAQLLYGAALAVSDKFIDAERALAAARALPDSTPECALAYARLLSRRSDKAEAAAAAFEVALTRSPLEPVGYTEAGRYYLKQGDYAKAVENLRIAAQLSWGAAAEIARAEWEQASAMQEQLALQANNAAAAALREGKFTAARERYEEAIRIYPGGYHVLSNLCYLLATCPDKAIRDGKRAVELAERLLATVGDNPSGEHLANAAAAFAEAGNFPRAQELVARAIAKAEESGQEQQKAALLEVQASYAESKPWRHRTD